MKISSPVFSAQSAIWIFVLALGINLFWEHWHYAFYIPIHPIVKSWYTLYLASFLDAFYITLLFAVFYRHGIKIVFLSALVLAVLIEWWALFFRVWQYNETMPIVPILGVGLSPTIQLAVSVLIIWLVIGRSKSYW